ncbi:ribose-phosphate diphosphokinase [Tuberibacillus sp. Marseille-P3662]|uniref:ribose-phosphate diphosphokinase n=1 Tax=Tuberibacillus sp. Marseille-P3662 TaxID=1965358 RepID=UPI000A1CDEDF|nr:ribose-phosphate diphosphokinase [Tuberibacillus sp. Marseille-P3662]
MKNTNQKIKLFTLNSNSCLAEEIAKHTGIPLGSCSVKKFSDGEIQINIEESIRGCDIFVIQSTSDPINENLMELLIMIDALKRASAKNINVVIPYYGYARQDRKASAREPITAKLVANLLETAGASRVLTIDLHAPQIQGFFDVPVDQLLGVPILSNYFRQKNKNDLIIVAPDNGGVYRARKMAERLNVPIAFLDKRRPEPNSVEVMNIIGDVGNKHAVIIDDIIDTAGTIKVASRVLKQYGARKVSACCTHPVLSGPAVERIESSEIEELVVTNTISLPNEKQIDNMTTLSVAPLLAEAIKRVYDNLSVSELFEKS